MKLDFTKKEVNYFKDNCYFSDDEEQILELRLRNKSIVEIMDIMKMNESTVNRRIKSIKKKIMKSI